PADALPRQRAPGRVYPITSVAQKRHALGGTNFCAQSRGRNSFPLISPFWTKCSTEPRTRPCGLAHSLRCISMYVSHPYAHVVRAGRYSVYLDSFARAAYNDCIFTVIYTR